jgi:Leucine-rich repeat (LRR) protein
MNKEWYPELDLLNLSESSIKTITGMDKMKVKKLVLPVSAEMLDPDGLPMNVTSIGMTRSKTNELKGLEKRNIEDIDASFSEIQFINPDGVPGTLKRIDLSGSKLRTLGGLNKTDVKKIDMDSAPEIVIIDQAGLPPGLEVLKVRGSATLEKVPDLNGMTSLSQLDFSGNANLKEIGRLPSAAEKIDVSYSGIKSLGDLHYSSLKEIYATDCKKLTKIDSKEIGRAHV